MHAAFLHVGLAAEVGRRFQSLLLGLAAAVLSASSAHADTLEVSPIFGDGAVLQRGEPITLWGSADPGAEIVVELGEASAHTLTASNGRWFARLEAQQAARGLSLTVTSADQTVTRRDIAVGDVFLCSGQSNMGFTLAETALHPDQRRQPVDATIGLLKIAQDRSPTELSALSHKPVWSSADATGQEFSAVCLLAGRELARGRRDVPIGLIDASWGGTPIEAWLPYYGLVQAGGMDEGVAILKAYRDNPRAADARYAERIEELWTPVPASPGIPRRGRMAYGTLFNGMLAPFTSMRFAGAIWYQGENNASNLDTRAEYQAKLGALVASWRSRFGPDLAFVIVQLAPFGPLSRMAEDNNWAEIREAQRLVTERDPRAELVVTADVGERFDIHPPMKLPVGLRAARALEVLLYGADRSTLGPRPQSAELAGDRVIIGIEGGPEPLFAASWGRPGPFQLCAAEPNDCRYADATFIEGGIAVEVPEGYLPERVRYCWGAAPICNVFAGGQHPLGPFELTLAEGEMRGE